MKAPVSALLTALLISGSATAATVYKKVDENGNLIFSDTPMDNAETIDVPPVPTLKLNSTPKQPILLKDKPKAFKYEQVVITQPAHDETFVNNQGTVTIQVQVSPGLKPEHRLELLLNGVKRAGPSADTSFKFSNLDRGSYSASVQVVDAKGKVVIASPSVSFHIKRSFVRAN